MVAAADELKAKLAAAGGDGVDVSLTGASGMWSDFNTANRTAMMRSELYSWPVTLGILVLAFGSLLAAGLPLLLTILGLLASAGLLAILTHGFEISIWAMNFALVFALALGIDYALFVAPSAPLRPGRDARARAARPARPRPEDRHAVDQGRAAGRLLARRLRPRTAGVRAGRAGGQGIAAVSPSQPGAAGLALVQATPAADPSSTAAGRTIDRLRRELPPDALVGGASAENHDLERALSARTPVVIGVVLALGFLLLLVALQAPVVAALGVATNLLATGAAFGFARLVFQDGHGAGLLGFEPQGFLDAWGPVFFFAMIFAISMDYTVFLLSSAKEHLDRSGDPREAAVGGLAHSGQVVFAAAAVMVAVFLTFALSGPLPPKEMGVILGVAVLLDAMLVRLVLIPTLLRAFGRWALGATAPLHRLLPDVRFGHG
jgi:uncharacterized membrane protein YdfJ with MMPL/SSD domain